MFDADALKYLVPAVVAVVGWFAAHQFNVSGDRHNKRRDLRIQFLLDAYRRLESAADRDERTREQALAFESAVADIQLLGSSEQVEATVTFLREHAARSGATVDPVLQLLRSDLRQEPGLSGAVERAVVFRFTHGR